VLLRICHYTIDRAGYQGPAQDYVNAEKRTQITADWPQIAAD
jgi:hypothetical protein